MTRVIGGPTRLQTLDIDGLQLRMFLERFERSRGTPFITGTEEGKDQTASGNPAWNWPQKRSEQFAPPRATP